MTWMSLPVSTYDKYVDPVNGSDSYDGSTWALAKETCGSAASVSGTYGRIWLTGGTHTISSTVTYENKKLQWIGPPITSGFTDPGTGSAYITGSGLTHYFEARNWDKDLHGGANGNLYGGGFRDLFFNMNGVSATAILTRNANYMRMYNLHGRASSGTHRNVYILTDDESNYATSAAVQDRSWWHIRDVSAFNCGILDRQPGAAAVWLGANGWVASNLNGVSDAPNGATIPFIRSVDSHFRALVLNGAFFKNSATGVSPIYIDNSTNSTSAMTFIGVSFADLRSPYIGAEFYRTPISVMYPGGNGTTDGQWWADSLSEGFYAGPSSGISGEAGNSISIGEF